MKKSLLILLSLFHFTLVLAKTVPITIYHTNDLHSHFDGIKVPSGNSFEQRGGYSRIKTIITDLKRKHHNEVIIGVDAGDFFSGTIFSGIAVSQEKETPEYDFFLENKYDLMTLGNHEFDAKNIGLLKMLEKISQKEEKVPFVASNLYVSSLSPLQKFVGENKLIRRFLIKDYATEKGTIRIGFLGVLGPDGCLVSRSTREDIHFIGFNDDHSKMELSTLTDHLNSMIEELKNNQKADLIILSMHGGGKEAIELASRLKGLNVLIAGHTHKQEFSIVNNIIINQTGSYGENLGLLEFNYDFENKNLTLKDSKTNPYITVTDKIKKDVSLSRKIDRWRKKSFELMGQLNSPDEIIFTPKKSYIRSSNIPNPMGQLVTNSLLSELNQQAIKKGEDPLDAYFTSMGLIRTSFHKNIPYSRAEVFESVSIGFDEKLVPGVDVVSFYLTAKEVRLIVNFMEVYTFISTSFSPAISKSLDFKIRRWGIPFINRIHELKLNGKNIEDYDRLIKIATNKFVVLNIETVKKITRGWVEIVPKTKTGEPIKTFTTHQKEFELLSEHFIKNPNVY
jgi:5'-nucleotidase/UDP-sugar diphosphatase